MSYFVAFTVTYLPEGDGKCYRSVNSVTMADFLKKMFAKIKMWIAWLWTYLWALWFLLVVFVVYILRGPLRIGENFTSGLLALVSRIETARHNFLVSKA